MVKSTTKVAGKKVQTEAEVLIYISNQESKFLQTALTQFAISETSPCP